MHDPANYTTPYLKTAADVRRYVNTANPIVEGKMELLHGDLTPKNVMPDGGNDISQFILTASIQWAAAGDYSSTCNATFDGELGDYIDFSTDLVRFSLVYYNGDGSIALGPIPKGVFGFPVSKRVPFDDGNSIYTVTGFDELWYWALIEFLVDYVVPRGYPPELVVRVMAMMDYKSPSDGGRPASGIALGGTPQATVPTGYATTGVLASSVCTLNGTTGYLDSPSGVYGVISYNPYDTAVRCDPTTYAPISPITGRPMALTSRATSTTLDLFYDSGFGLYFRTATGEFLNAAGVVVDPFKGTPYQTGSFVKQPNPLGGGGPWGYYTPPLTTFPDDWDHTLGYFTPTTAGTVTVSSGTQPAPSSLSIGDGTMGTRYGLGPTVVLPAGTYALGSTHSITDPAHPATQWTQAVAASSSTGMVVSAANWSFTAETWTLATTFTGLPHPTGSLSITCDVYKGTTLLGTLASDGTGSFDGSAQSTVTVTCSGAMPSITLGGTDSLRFDVKVTTSDITAQIGATDYSGGFSGSATVQFGAAPTVGAGGSYFNPGTPATPTAPTTSSTGISWPDANNPGLAPSGCETVGPNCPAERLSLPVTGEVTPYTVTHNRKDKLLAAMNTVLDNVGCYKFFMDEVTEHFTSRFRPYFSAGSIPQIEWTFSNDDPLPDGDISGITENIDLSNTWNVELALSESNGAASPIWAKRTNESASSLVGRDRIKRSMTHINQQDTLTAQADLDNIADDDLAVGDSGALSLDCIIPLNPFLTLYSCVNIKIKNWTTGEYTINGDEFPFIVQAYTLHLKEKGEVVGQMEFTCSQTVSLG